MRLLPWLTPLAVAAATVAVPSLAHAGDRVLLPVSGGMLHGRYAQAAIIQSGLGWYDERLELNGFGRAGVGDRLSFGMGGLRGAYAFLQDERKGRTWQVGIDLGISAGGGKRRGKKMGVLAAVEPGLFVRLVTKKAGALQAGIAWYQPLRIRPDELGYGGMWTIAWIPTFKRL